MKHFVRGIQVRFSPRLVTSKVAPFLHVRFKKVFFYFSNKQTRTHHYAISTFRMAYIIVQRALYRVQSVLCQFVNRGSIALY